MKSRSKIFLISLGALVVVMFGRAFAQEGEDGIPPWGTIVAAPVEVRVDEIFNITVSGEDNIDMGAVCYKEENDTEWLCYNCDAVWPSCSHSFSRSELGLGRYRYYGYLVDAARNSSFTDPDHQLVLVEKDPSVGTISVTDLQATQATLNGYLVDLGGAGSCEVWFEWGVTTGYGNETGHISKSTPGSFSVTISGLTPGTVYHFRAVAKNGVGTSFAEDMVTTELIANGSFESGDINGWSTTRLGHYQADRSDVHGGLYAGLLGFKEGPNEENGRSALYQEISVPSAATNIDLSLWYKFYTTDKCPYDFLNIYLKDTSDRILKTYLEWCCEGCSGLNTYGWHEITDDLSDFAGQTLRIYFEVENNSDQFHRSWAYVDNVSIRYLPVLLSSVTTKEATNIKTNQAVLNGELTNMGGADSVDVWFVWGPFESDDWQKYPHQTNPVSKTVTGPFAATIGNLNPRLTYHFRAVARNSAGTVAGDDMSFSTDYSAAGGWIWSDVHEDPDRTWREEERAHDGDKITRARNNGETGWRGFIVFDLVDPIKSNEVRVSATGEGAPGGVVPIADVDILYDGNATWTDLYEGTLPENHDWVKFDLPYEGMVIKGRFRFNHLDEDWYHTLDEFQFYEVPDEPITPPAGVTEDATSIEENSAILHGMITDDGRDLCRVRFQYADEETYQRTGTYDMTTPWDPPLDRQGFWASGEGFGRLISGLEEGERYHFRAQIQNNAGLANGADKTFFTQSALSGWVSPQEAWGDGWENVVYGFDDELETYTRRIRDYVEEERWSPYIYFYHPEISSDKVRFWAHEPFEIDAAQVDVRVNGEWQENVFRGSFIDGDWQEVSFSGGRVDQARVKFHMKNKNNYFYYLVQEFDFWKIADEPSVVTLDTGIGDVGSDWAKMRGRLTDLGGAHSVDVWFVWDTDYHDNWEDYTDSSFEDKDTLGQKGRFEQTIFGLSSATTYHFRAVASSVAGVSFGEDKTFTTSGECSPGETKTCVSGEGCSHTIECPKEGYWPPCPRDECIKNTPDTADCLCPAAEDGCLGADYYDYPDYGDCTDSCTCDISTDPGGPCAVVIYPNDLRCNRPPEKPSTSQYLEYCNFTGSPQVALGTSITFNWTYSDPDDDPQGGYEVWVDDNPNFQEPKFNFRSSVASLGYSLGLSDDQEGDWLSELEWGKTYYWQVRVRDERGELSRWSEWSDSSHFKIPKHAYPWPDFTHFRQYPSLGEVVWFIDQSKCYSHPGNIEYNCRDGGGNIGYEWDFDYVDTFTVDSTNKGHTTTTFADSRQYEVRLRITDISLSPPGSCTGKGDSPVGVGLPAPKWKEVAP